MGDIEDVQRLYQRLDAEIKILLNNIIELCYFMRGAISYDHTLFDMTFVERDMINTYISKRLEQESKSPSPIY